MCETHLRGHVGIPVKGMAVLYQPKPSSSLVIFAGGQDRCSTGSDSASFPHTTPSVYFSADLEGPPLDLTRLHLLAMQVSFSHDAWQHWIQWH